MGNPASVGFWWSTFVLRLSLKKSLILSFFLSLEVNPRLLSLGRLCCAKRLLLVTRWLCFSFGAVVSRRQFGTLNRFVPRGTGHCQLLCKHKYISNTGVNDWCFMAQLCAWAACERAWNCLVGCFWGFGCRFEFRFRLKWTFCVMSWHFKTALLLR